VPLYNPDPKTDEEKAIFTSYAKVLGSAVNPVLREGNSDRRVAAPVKNYAKKNPHTLGAWSRASKTHVAHMTKGDFYGSEQSYIMPAAGSVKIELKGKDGSVKVLKDGLKLQAGEVIDASAMNVAELKAFINREIADAQKENMLLSLHLKATMMKISDPIMFGHFVTAFFEPVFTKYAAEFKSVGINPNNGFNDVLEKIKKLPQATTEAIKKDIDACYESRPWLAMVDSGKGEFSFHMSVFSVFLFC
jgi:isocitrate dehydrogenase